MSNDFHMPGATSPQLQTEAEILKAIREATRQKIKANFLSDF